MYVMEGMSNIHSERQPRRNSGMDHMRMQRHGFDIITGKSQATALSPLPQEADEVSRNTRRTSVDTDLSRRTSAEFKDIDFFGYM